MASYSERYHEYTKYNPDTIGKIGPVHWADQPPLFQGEASPFDIALHPHLAYLTQNSEQVGWLQPNRSPRSDLLGLIASTAYFSVGITHILRHDEQYYYFRANPSAGGLYPTEMFLCIRNCPEIHDGIYAFHPLYLSLRPLDTQLSWDELSKYFFDEPSASQADLIAIFCGRVERSSWRYKDRAYRRILLDAGHAIANTAAFLEYHDIPHQILGGFKDQDLARALGLDPIQEPPLCAVAFNFDAQSTEPARLLRSAEPRIAVKRTQSDLDMLQNQILVEQCQEAWEIPAPLCHSPNCDLELPKPQNNPFNVPASIRIRRSCRNFGNQDLSLEQISNVFHYAFEAHTQSFQVNALLENYLVVRKVQDIPQGVYRLCPHSLSLEKVQDFYEWNPFFLACLSQDIAVDASALLVHACDLNQVTAIVGDRGYRYLCLEAGRIVERLNLAGVAAKVGISGVGGYFDDLLGELLGLERNQAIIYAACMGIEHE